MAFEDDGDDERVRGAVLTGFLAMMASLSMSQARLPGFTDTSPELVRAR